MLPAHPLVRVLLDQDAFVQVVDDLGRQFHILVGVIKFLDVELEDFVLVVHQLVVDVLADTQVGLT